MNLSIACYNHYQQPIAFEQVTLIPYLKRALQILSQRQLFLSEGVLHTLEEVEYNLVDDQTIADIHAKFMNDPTPTDVITFHHGEVFVSYDTAQREASDRNIPLQEELLRYHIHGLLHLAGYEDQTSEEFEHMTTLQESLITELLS